MKQDLLAAPSATTFLIAAPLLIICPSSSLTSRKD
jgi:hypothetical protein